MFFSFYQDGEKVATRFSCKYVEISLVLNHNVDDLLVGIVRQARAQYRHDSSNLSSSTEKQRNKVRQFTNKLVKRWRKIRPKRSRCNNLFDAWCKRLRTLPDVTIEKLPLSFLWNLTLATHNRSGKQSENEEEYRRRHRNCRRE